MKTLIVYYSLEGNTEYTAKAIASELQADLLRLEPVKAYPSGKVSKFIWGGKSAVMSETPELKPYTIDPSGYDCIILGFPVWASSFAPPLRTFIRKHPLKGKKIAAFACQAGNGAEKALAKLKKELDTDALAAELILIEPKAHPAPDTQAKIQKFCERL